MPGTEVKANRPVPMSAKESELFHARAEQRYILLDSETAELLLNQLSITHDGMPVHGLLVRDDATQVVTRSTRENGEQLPANDFLNDPNPRRGRNLAQLIHEIKIEARNNPSHSSAVREIVVIDRTTRKGTFGLSELADVEKTAYGWTGILKGRLQTRVIILSKAESLKGIAEFSPPSRI